MKSIKLYSEKFEFLTNLQTGKCRAVKHVSKGFLTRAGNLFSLGGVFITGKRCTAVFNFILGLLLHELFVGVIILD